MEVFAARDAMLAPFTHTKESALFQQAVYAKFGRSYEATPQAKPHIVASVASDPSRSENHSKERLPPLISMLEV